MTPDRLRARLLAAALPLALAACSDGVLPPAPARPVPDEAGALRCVADVRAAAVRCGEPATGASLSRNLGGQGVYVRLTSANVAYDSVSGVFRADVTVQNLLPQRLGTADGATVAGVRVFFHQEPAAVAGAGVVEVANADGHGSFTAANQPFFRWPESLAPGAVSAARRWEFAVPKSVQQFAFTVYVNAPVLPAVVFDQPVSGGGREIVRIGIDGGDRTVLSNHATEDRDPSVAAGRVVWVGYRDGNGELYAMPVTGGAATRLTATAGTESEPALSPDGQKLAYILPVGGVGKVWVAAADGSGAARAFPSFGFDGGPESGPDWWPDMTAPRLLFTAAPGNSADLYSGRLAGAPALSVGGGAADVEGAVSPDGSRIAFASTRSADEDTELYVQTVATGAVTRLTTRAGIDASPTWLADGRIVYVAMEANSTASRLRILDPAAPASARDIPNTTGARRPAALRF